MKVLHLNADWEQWPEYRLLKASLGESEAIAALVKLFRSLAYGVESLGPEMIGASNRLLVQADVGERAMAIMCQGPSPLLATHATNQDLVFCRRFAESNGHLDPGFKPSHVRGHELSAFKRRMTKVYEASGEAVLELNPTWFLGPNGEAMPADQVKQVYLFVHAVDAALGRRSTREAHEFSEGLIRTASVLVRKWDGQEVERRINLLMTRRGHPGLPTTAEQLLAAWVEEVGGEKGGRE